MCIDQAGIQLGLAYVGPKLNPIRGYRKVPYLTLTFLGDSGELFILMFGLSIGAG